MARPLRSHLPDGIYHVTARAVDGADLFRDDHDRQRFLRLLAECVERYGWRCHAFCLMTNHYHLIVETTQAQLSAGFQRLNGVYAQRFNARHVRRGHLFGDRFAAWLVGSEDYLRAAITYVLLNPVRAGLAATPDAWPWSAAAATAAPNDPAHERPFVTLD